MPLPITSHFRLGTCGSRHKSRSTDFWLKLSRKGACSTKPEQEQVSCVSEVRVAQFVIMPWGLSTNFFAAPSSNSLSPSGACSKGMTVALAALTILHLVVQDRIHQLAVRAHARALTGKEEEGLGPAQTHEVAARPMELAVSLSQQCPPRPPRHARWRSRPR